MNPRRPRWPLALRLMQHHMQWADAHREERLHGALGLLADHRFGLISGSLEDRSLESGTVAVRDLVVVFPSGLWAEAARLEMLLPPFHDVDGEQTVFVAIRRSQPHLPAVSNDGKDHRFQRTFQTLGDSPDSAVATATPVVVLHVGTSLPDELEGIPLARIVRRLGRPLYEQRSAPPVLSVGVAPVLRDGLQDLLARIDDQDRRLAAIQRWDPGEPERFDVSDAPVLTLRSLLGRYRARLAALTTATVAPPRRAWEALLGLCGALGGVHGLPDAELTTFDPDHPSTAFAAVLDEIARRLQLQVPTPLEVLPLTAVEPMLLRTRFPRALQDRPFWLAVSAEGELPVDDRFLSLAKVGAMTRVRETVRAATQGVPFAVEHQLPSVLPRRKNRVYYRLDTSHPLFKEVAAAEELAVYQPTQERKLELVLIVARGG